MPSLRSTLLAAALLAITQADYIIDPETVSKGMRKRWCEDQTNTCPFICAHVDSRRVMENECNPDSLTYACICGNGRQPDMSEFTLTLPYHTCTEFGNQCVKACPAYDHSCASACRSENQCGARNPNPPNGTATAAPAPKSTSDDKDDDDEDDEDKVFEGLAGADDKDNAARVIGKGYGLAVVAGALFAGFALL